MYSQRVLEEPPLGLEAAPKARTASELLPFLVWPQDAMSEAPRVYSAPRAHTLWWSPTGIGHLRSFSLSWSCPPPERAQSLTPKPCKRHDLGPEGPWFPHTQKGSRPRDPQEKQKRGPEAHCSPKGPTVSGKVESWPWERYRVQRDRQKASEWTGRKGEGRGREKTRRDRHGGRQKKDHR